MLVSRQFRGIGNLPPVKYAVNRAGFSVGSPRLPLVPADEKAAAQIDAVVSRYDIDLPIPASTR